MCALALRLPRVVICMTRSGSGTRSTLQICFRATRPPSPGIARPDTSFCILAMADCIRVFREASWAASHVRPTRPLVSSFACVSTKATRRLRSKHENAICTRWKGEMSMMSTDIWINSPLQSCTSTSQRKRRCWEARTTSTSMREVGKQPRNDGGARVWDDSCCQSQEISDMTNNAATNRTSLRLEIWHDAGCFRMR